jgi:CheY-like chemotaxis protein
MIQVAGKSRILLIEDDPVVSTILRVALERAGYEVCQASDGKECLDRAASGGGFDLLLSDVVLEGRSAIPLLDRLKSVCPAAPVLMVSGYPLHLLEERGYLMAGAVDHRRNFFLQKPFMPAELTATVGRVLAARDGCRKEPEGGNGHQ